MARAKTLEEARKVLDPRPLDFFEQSPQGTKIASDPAFYAPPPGERRTGGFKLPGPIERIRQRLLSGTSDTKVFLSGHVGSGKSTELNRLMADGEIQGRFHVVSLRFEEQEWATLDSSQMLLRIAGELFDKHRDQLAKVGRWKKVLKGLNDRIFEPMGVRLTDSSTSLEISAFFLKFRQDLKLSAKVRQQFREVGETNQSALQDFIKALVDDIENALSEGEGPTELLVVADDLDKLRTIEQHKDIFDTNLSALLSPPLRVVYTVPTAVRFANDVRAEIRQAVEDLYPVQVLRKAPDVFNPEKAITDERMGFFQTLVERRVEPGLVEPEAIRLAAIYAGGVLRDFFRLLREAVLLATYNDQKIIDTVAMRYAIDDARRKESVGLYVPDLDALVHVHRTNGLRETEDRRYLALSRVIECFNGAVWFDANPLLWSLLEEHLKRVNVQSGKT